MQTTTAINEVKRRVIEVVDEAGVSRWPAELPPELADRVCPHCGVGFTYAPTFEGQPLEMGQTMGDRLVLWTECTHLRNQRAVVTQSLYTTRAHETQIDWKTRSLRPVSKP